MFFGMPRPFYNQKGEDVKAVVGFISSIGKLLKKLKAERVVVVFDTETSTSKRLDAYDDYKQNRIDYSQVADEENPFLQLPKIIKTLDHMGVYYIEARDHEADDYIASICEKYQSDYEVFIVSTDSDFNQLVNDRIKIFNPRGRDGAIYDEDKVYEKLGVTPKRVVEYKALVGDTSDNISGVKGIGPKRAVEILNHGTLNQILDGQTDLAEKYSSKILEAKETVLRNLDLIEMIKDLEITISDRDMVAEYDVNKSAIRLIEEAE
jgi:DNA polymerase-1